MPRASQFPRYAHGDPGRARGAAGASLGVISHSLYAQRNLPPDLYEFRRVDRRLWPGANYHRTKTAYHHVSLWLMGIGHTVRRLSALSVFRHVSLPRASCSSWLLWDH